MKFMIPMYVLKYEDDSREKVEYFENVKEFQERYDYIRNDYYVHCIRCYQGTVTEID